MTALYALGLVVIGAWLTLVLYRRHKRAVARSFIAGFVQGYAQGGNFAVSEAQRIVRGYAAVRERAALGGGVH